jgi:hypothetical protein
MSDDDDDDDDEAAKLKAKVYPNMEDNPALDVERLNKNHAVLPIGGKTRVVTFGELEEFPGRTTIVMAQTFGDFKNLHNKYRHEYEHDGETKTVGLGSHWLNSPNRRQYDGGQQFLPMQDGDVGNKLNLWRGFGVQPIKPNGKSGAVGCKLYLKFVYDVTCSGNAEHYDYLIKREATIVQERRRTEVALALRTEEEGVGKNFFDGAQGHLLGDHAMTITNPDHIIGKFNPHLETLLRLTANEALFVGNHQHRNALFSLITEPKLTIEPKGCGVYAADNFLNISVISNNLHFIPVGVIARRFFVPSVSSAHRLDFPYFKKIQYQLMNEGGYQALLYHLLYEVSLRDFEIRKVPLTAGLAEQIAYGRKGVDGLVERVCNEGRVPCEHLEWKGFTITTGDGIREGFYDFINRQKDQELVRLGPLTVIRRLNSEWGCLTGVQKRAVGDRTRGFYWPALDELRQKFEDKFGKQEWANADVTEWSLPTF